MSDSGLHIDIKARFGALELDLSERWESSGVTALFGPSGSGKTSILRLIAGFAKPDAGRISFGEEVWFDRSGSVFYPPHKRPIGFVHQGGQLLPKTVHKNVHYAEVRSVKRSTRPHPLLWDRDTLIEMFELGELLERTPDTLSGGERQRVALAQAILVQPRVLLLDEPLSALDGTWKARLLSILAELAAVQSLPIVYVSHDTSEVARIANHVVVIRGGAVVASGEPVAMLNAHGFGRHGSARSGTVLAGKVAAHDTQTQLMSISIGPHRVKLPLDATRPVGSDLRMIIHASNVVLSTQAPVGLSVQNALAGTILAIEPDEGTALAHVTLTLDGTDGASLVACVTRAAVAELGLAVGQDIHALIKTAVLAR